MASSSPSFLLFLFLALVSVAIANVDVPTVPIPDTEETDIDAVTEISYSEISRLYKGDWFLIVYAPWCGHCMSLMASMPEIVEAVQGHIKIVKMDGTDHDALHYQFGVKGYPSIFHLHDGEVRVYLGDRSPESIGEFVKSQWKDTPPLTGWNSPTYLPVRIIAQYIDIVSPLVTISENAGKRFDIAPEIIVVVAGLCIITVLSLSGYFYVQKLKKKYPGPGETVVKSTKIKEN